MCEINTIIIGISHTMSSYAIWPICRKVVNYIAVARLQTSLLITISVFGVSVHPGICLYFPDASCASFRLYP